MESTNLIVVLSLAFSLGMLHALDADHIMAVSALMTNQSNRRRNLGFCLRWAAGHGAVLLLIGIALVTFGYHLPEAVGKHSELIVGVMLVAIGCYLLSKLIRRKAHLHFHRHDGIPAHSHWHVHEKSNTRASIKASHKHDHAAVIVGVLHGLAGSAPLLALIPVSMMQSPAKGILYILIFSLGVILSMLIFGGLFGHIMKLTQRRGEQATKYLRLFTAAGSIVIGATIIRSVLA